VALAKTVGLDALAITDHDTFAGYEAAAPLADRVGLDLVRGIELNTKLNLPNGDSRHLHLLAYFPLHAPSNEFLNWLAGEQEDRRSRNSRLVESLQHAGIDITLREVEARGRSLAGRPHFAKILVEKGYATDYDEAFRKYIGDGAPAYVERESQTAETVIQIVRAGGGIPVVAHPVRLSLAPSLERQMIARLRDAGLIGLEVYHSEHSPDLQVHYRLMAEQLDLLPTGGSDFHGSVKPGIALGTGFRDNIRVPHEFLDQLRQECRAIVNATL
jgi:predicted metal-dependent phosphoesterase TrpH